MSSSHRRTRAAHLGALIAGIGLACASPAPRGADSTTPNPQAVADDTTRLAQMEREARALVRNSGCVAASSCRVAPVGSRACGGPREYVVYCAASTDTVALLRKLEELERAEMDYNQRTGMVSTCEMRLPPGVVLQGGHCAASARPAGGEPPPS